MRLDCTSGIRTVIAISESGSTRDVFDALAAVNPVYVGVAENGYEAVEMTRRLMPDLLIVDMILPIWDGLEVVRRVKGLPVFTMPLTLMMSPTPMYPYDGDAKALGVYRILRRPFEEDEVVEAVSSARVTDRIARDDLSDERIRQCLFALGFSAKLPGTSYLAYAIFLAALDCRIARNLGALYDHIAGKWHSDPDRVAHAMRRAIESAWSGGALDRQHALFGNTIDARRGKPTNGEMIARIAELLRVKEI